MIFGTPEKGQKVHYIGFEGAEPKNGIIKSIQDEDHAFVVFHCAGEWEKYEDYTAARTEIKQLYHSWHYDSIEEMQANCSHDEWEYTNAKWQPLTQRRCIDCGLIRD